MSVAESVVIIILFFFLRPSFLISALLHSVLVWVHVYVHTF